MDIYININKPSFIVYYYEGFITVNDAKYCFEVIDKEDDLSVNWLDDYNLDNKSDIEDEIINKFETLWKF